MEPDRFDPDEWPHGLRCMDCDTPFVEGQPISERLDSVGEFEGESAVTVDVICVGCAVAQLGTDPA